MTAYFDTFHAALAAAQHLPDDTRGDQLAALESAFVDDITLAIELPGFPEDLRDECHLAMLRGARCASAHLMQLGDPADTDTDDAWIEGLSAMGTAVHTIFHTFATREGQSDGPTTRRRAYLTQGEERRETLLQGMRASRREDGSSS